MKIWRFKSVSWVCDQTRVMGIINLSQDSFSEPQKSGSGLRVRNVIERACQCLTEGADILDLGAESTRPGADPVPFEVERDRLLPILRLLRKETKIPISIDTTKPAVAEICLSEGADIINDVSGLNDSGRDMADLVRAFEAGYVLMHRRGGPKTMQQLTDYPCGVEDMVAELNANYLRALEWGIPREQIVLDPGIGFAKTGGQNLEILRALEKIEALGRPVLLGYSRKSFIGGITGRSDAGEREFGTAALTAYAVMKKIPLIRVHNVGAAKDVISMIQAIQEEKYVRSF
ncbi:MAG: dihydropteroate synthase [Omnitrophica bacterium GWA2_52_8]|nr:MAG: dihydropteroate synthase [Omnitrophica bacterium GWA2_52_8]